MRVDGTTYAAVGSPGKTVDATPLSLVDRSVNATHTEYQYTIPSGNVKIVVRFQSNNLISELYAASRPVSYVAVEASSLDGEEHAVEV